MSSIPNRATSSAGSPCGRDVLLEGALHGVDDLAPAAVADRHVHLEAAASCRGGGGLLEHPGAGAGQHVERADRPDLPVPALGGDVPDGLLDDLDQRAELFGGAAQVVVGEHEEGHVLDPGSRAPAQERGHLGTARPVALPDVRVPGLPGPAPVAVDHDPHVLGARQAHQTGGEPTLVHRFDRPHGGTGEAASWTHSITGPPTPEDRVHGPGRSCPDPAEAPDASGAGPHNGPSPPSGSVTGRSLTRAASTSGASPSL